MFTPQSTTRIIATKEKFPISRPDNTICSSQRSTERSSNRNIATVAMYNMAAGGAEVIDREGAGTHTATSLRGARRAPPALCGGNGAARRPSTPTCLSAEQPWPSPWTLASPAHAQRSDGEGELRGGVGRG